MAELTRPLGASMEGLDLGDRPEPCIVVLFGASGDLGVRELVPSLFELFVKSLLPDPFAVVGFSRSDWSDDEYRSRMRRSVDENCSVGREAFGDFAPHLYYVQGDVGDEDAYRRLSVRLHEIRQSLHIADRSVFHLALPPRFFPDAVRGLQSSGLAGSTPTDEHLPPDPADAWPRLVIEKPFGSDVQSAKGLDRTLRGAFAEERIYRIDHFLGKETVQNMLAFRFANAEFEPIWDARYIDHVQITVAEDKGVRGRADFYEDTGVIRDMVQNHLLQLLCMAAIESPMRMDARSLRDETVKVLRALNVEPVDLHSGFVAGQYGPGHVGGKPATGYREEEGVGSASQTPTFAALKLTIDNARWKGVPFYLRTGKRMEQKRTEVAVHFSPTAHHVFSHSADSVGDRTDAPSGNALVFRLQPNEAIIRTFLAKRPGPEFRLEQVRMHFDYPSAFGIEHPPRAYAWLLHDVMRGDQTLFARSDWIEEAWLIVDPVVQHLEQLGPAGLQPYAAGSWGPPAANALLHRDGRKWQAE